jgi:hypothetical protein
MAEFEKGRLCVIKSDGTTARGHMIDNCEFDDADEYVTTWKIALRKAAKTNLAYESCLRILPTNLAYESCPRICPPRSAAAWTRRRRPAGRRPA